jgi:hypothetical protein
MRQYSDNPYLFAGARAIGAGEVVELAARSHVSAPPCSPPTLRPVKFPTEYRLAARASRPGTAPARREHKCYAAG